MASKCNIFKAILTRLLFIMHAMLVIWRATVVKGPLYWVLTSTLAGLIFEMIIVIMVNKGEEWKWFCPSVFFYLASVVPSIWLLELNRIDQLRVGLKNVTTTSVKLGEMELSLELSEQEWVLLIEQAMMVLLIVGRWLLPKGELTRAQLSQLLLVYLALAADMIDFFTIFGEKGTIRDQIFVYAILSGWSWSLMQFTIVLTATKSRRMRIVTPEEQPAAEVEEKDTAACGCCETELWSILMTTFMQDGPYFVLRMVALIYYRVFSYSILFFTCKNGMILLLQLYRLIVTSVEMRQKKKEEAERRKLKALGSCETIRKLSLVGDKYIRERSNDSGNSSVG